VLCLCYACVLLSGNSGKTNKEDKHISPKDQGQGSLLQYPVIQLILMVNFGGVATLYESTSALRMTSLSTVVCFCYLVNGFANDVDSSK
jgi:hypothetical protein